jgi:hypothetical protein
MFSDRDPVRRRLRGRSAASVLVVTALFAATPPAAAQSDEQRAAARSIAIEGAKAFSEGRYQDSLDLFQRAESLVHAPPHLLYQARAQEKLGHVIKAHELYLKISREKLNDNAPQAFRDAQAAALDGARQLEPKIAYLTVQLQGDGGKPVDVTMDGEPVPPALIGVPRPVDPGEHRIQGKGIGLLAAPQVLTLAEGARSAVTLVFEAAPVTTPATPAPATTPAAPTEPAAPPRDAGTSSGSPGLRYASYGAFGVGVVGVALGTVFGLKSRSDRSDADKLYSEKCRPACDKTGPDAKQIASLDDSARSAMTLSIVGFSVGGAGAAAGVVLFLMSNKHGETPEHGVSIRPWFGLGSAGVSGRF